VGSFGIMLTLDIHAEYSQNICQLARQHRYNHVSKHQKILAAMAIPTSELSPEVAALKSKGVFLRLISAVKYSIQGLRAGWQHEAALRSEMVALLVLSVAALATPLSTVQRVVLVGSVLLVLVVELLNSAIEAVVDLASPALHPLAGRAKDMGSAAVMICVLFCCGLWAWIALPVWLRALGLL
jgi:diacylglycerol kinase (ATP)